MDSYYISFLIASAIYSLRRLRDIFQYLLIKPPLATARAP